MLELFEFNLLDTVLEVRQQFSGPISNHAEEFATPQTVFADSHSTVPDANNDHDVHRVHLLENCEQLVPATVLSVIVEAFSEDFSLRDRVQLVHSVGQDPVLGRRKLRACLRIRNIAEVINHEAHLVLVRDGRCKGLKLKFLMLLTLAIGDALDDSFKFLLVQVLGRVGLRNVARFPPSVQLL